MNGSRLLAVPAADDRRASFERFVDLRLDASYHLAAVLLGNRAEAEDATHDALVRAWERWPSLRDPERFEAWFQRVLVNVCRDRMRARRPGPVRDLDLAEPPDSAPPPDAIAERDALDRALARLNPDQRIAVVLRFGLDLSLARIGEVTGARLGTVKSRLHQGVRALAAAYASDERLSESESHR